MDIIQWTKQSSETEKKKRKYQINLLFAEKIIFSVQKL